MKTCQVIDCKRGHHAKGYCLRHYWQMQKHGKISGNSAKLIYGKPNWYLFIGDSCYIELYDNEGNVRDIGAIDAEDYNKVKDKKCWDKSRDRWIAQIKCNYKSIHLGRFNNKVDAAKAYNEAAIKYFGEFARLNET